jgi:hypothetical protein
MLQGHFYHDTIKKIVAAFGTMFNSILIYRYDSNGVETERMKVPLTYAQKEKFMTALLYDTGEDKIPQVVLPRMSFEWVSINYDAARKLPSLNKLYTQHPTDRNKLYQNFSPIPYNFGFDLNIYARTIEDLTQIIEQIIPTFTPDYTVTISLVDDNGQTIRRDVPILLNGVTPSIEYEGDGTTPRYVTCNMNFILQGYLFGSSQASAIIRKAITNIYDSIGEHEEVDLTMQAGGTGVFNFQEEVYSGNNWMNATWRGRVLHWSNNSQRRLSIYEVDGNPQANDVVYGLDSGAHWNIATLSRTTLKTSKTVIEPRPNTANVGDANITYSYTTTEFPRIIDE